MARPEIEIGDRVFQPRKMGVLESVRTHVLYGMGVLAADVYYPYYPQFRRVADEMRLGAFYGVEAVDAFIDAITPRVRSTIELQMLRQARCEGRAIPHLVMDPVLNQFLYQWNGNRVEPIVTMRVPERRISFGTPTA